MKKPIALLALLFVGGCASVPEPLPPPIVTKVEVVKVAVPYPVPCLAAADIPVLPVPMVIDVDKANARQIIAALAADLLSLERYSLMADPLLRQCAALVKPPVKESK